MNLFKETYKNVIDFRLGIKTLKKKSFEDNTVIYLKKLFFLSLVATFINFFINVFKTTYYYLFFEINIEIINFINYNLGKSLGAFFIYFVTGTLGVIFLGIILAYFLKEKSSIVFSKLYLALDPIILFGAIPILLPGLLIWVIQRFIIISKEFVTKEKIKGTIGQRE